MSAVAGSISVQNPYSIMHPTYARKNPISPKPLCIGTGGFLKISFLYS
jgi:hypothetical protein